MMNQKFKGLAPVFLVALILLFGAVLFFTSIESSITGFVVADNLTNETQSDESIIVDTVINESINETQTIVENETKEKGKPEKAEKPEPNQPPVWKSDVDEFVINGKTTIDLNNYFEDKNNDTIGYAAIASEPEKISIAIAASLITITPAGDNFNSNITIVASDGDKSTTKEVKLIVPERTITIALEYKSGSIYDVENDGLETTTGIIDLTIENTSFNWDVNENNLCTRWDTYSVEEQESTIVCYGSSRCCQFVDLLATKPLWNDPYFSSFGTYGATFNNIISAQVLYVDYDLSPEDAFAEIYNSEWSDLTANYYLEYSEFQNVCTETCLLTDFNETSYKLIFEIEDATLELDSLTYTLIETIDNVLVNLDVEDSQGITSGTYKLYKDNIEVIVVDNLVEPDYYDIEVIPSEKVIEKLLIYDVNITEPLTADIGVDDVGRQQEIEDVEIIKQYAIDTSELNFETAILTATATANSLFKCKQWAYEDEVCFGTWQKIKDLTVGQEYSLAITQDNPGFVEGNVNITPVSITEVVLIKNISDISIAKNNNAVIDLSNYFLNLDNDVVFTYNSIGNISIVFENSIATIVPDTDYIGAGFTFITANKSGILVSSNIFKITVANVTIDITPKITSKKKDFKFDEDVDIDFEFLKKEVLVREGRWKEEYEVYEEETDKTAAELGLLREKLVKKEKQIKKWQTASETIETFVFDSRGKITTIEPEIEELREGKFKIKLPKQRAFRAGKYTIKLELIKDSITYTQEQDFTWGVLAINVNKSIYLPNQDSFIGIAVLDDQGHMVCNANVTLIITDPLNNKEILSTENGSIAISPECEVYGVTNLPDYYTDYTVSGVGTYLMNLTAETFNGVRSILDNFSVQSTVDFDVARHGPTRIFPIANYTINFTINVNKNYNGVINEYVPANFTITPQAGLTIITVGDTKVLSWNVNLKQGNTARLYYEFDPPDVSPEFYLLGALEIGSWKEFRNWQIASDPSPPEFDGEAADPADSPDPVEDGSIITFAATATDPDTTDWALHVCKTNSVPSGNPSSCPGGNWCVSSNVNSGTEATCDYTTTNPDVGTNNWFGFPCDTTRRCGANAGDTTFTVSAVGVDETAPVLNGTLNKSIGDIIGGNGDVINFTYNVTDNVNLTNATIVFNMSGINEYFNFTFGDNGANPTNTHQFSQNFTGFATAEVLNVTGIARDNSSNKAQNENIFVVHGPEKTYLIPNESTDGGAPCATQPLDGLIDNDQGFETECTKADFLTLAFTNITGCKDNDTVTGIGIRFDAYSVTGIDANALEVYLSNGTLEDDNAVNGDTIYCLRNYNPTTDTNGENFTFNCEDEAQAGGLANISGVNTMYAHFDNNDGGGSQSIFIDNVNVTIKHICTVIPDTTPPRINASLNVPQIFQNIIVNMTANVTDNVGLDTCRFYMNGTSDGSFTILNKTVTGVSDQCSQNFTIDLEVGSVINFTVIINDTSTDTEGGNVNTSVSPTDGSVIGQILEVLPLNCTFLNKPDTVYNLTQDASSAATCFYIQANKITLDCKGFEINYSQSVVGYGVNISSQNRTTLRSCDIVQGSTSGSDGDGAYGVYIYRNSSNTNVFNNTIATLGDDGVGVYLLQQAYNNSVYGNTITTSGLDAIGVYLHQSTNNNNIFNNNITAIGGQGLNPSYGVNLVTNTYNNDIYNNNITANKNGGTGVNLFGGVYNNKIYLNTITTRGASTAHGMALLSTAYNNSVYSNTITIIGKNSDGVIFNAKAYNNSVYSNNITTSNITSHGINLWNNVWNNTIYDNNITTLNASSSFGIRLRDSVNNNTFYRNIISSLAAGIVINGSGQSAGESTRFNTFTNDTIVPCTNSTRCSDSYFDIILSSEATDITFLNVSFNKSRIQFAPATGGLTDKNNLTVQWYLDVNVTDSSDGSALQNAQVVINDSNAFNLFNDTTNAQGSIPTQIVTEFTMNGSTNSLDFFTADIDSCDAITATHNITCFTPHNISVNITGFGTGDLSIAINRSKDITISLTASVGALFVNISLPTNDTEVTANTTFDLIVNVTCLNADCGIVTGLARYNDSGSNVPNKSIRARYLDETSFPTPLFINGTRDGKYIWSYRHDSGDINDFAEAVATDSQDSIIVVGTHLGGAGADTEWNVTKVDSNGNYIWSYSADEGSTDFPFGVATDSRDNIIVVGDFRTIFNWNVTKLDSDGNQLWSYSYNTAGTDRPRAVATDSQDNIIVVGQHRSATDWNVTKLDSSNTAPNQLWSYSYDGGGTDIAYAVATDSQDNIIVVGTLSNSDWNVTKLDSNGIHIWSYRYDSGGNSDQARGVAVDSKDNIIVVGEHGSSGAADWNVTKLDPDGVQLWSYNYSGGGDDTARGVAVDSQDNIIVVGVHGSSKDWNVTKLDPAGNQLWSYSITGGSETLSDIPIGVAIDSNDNIIVVGIVNPVSTNRDWNVTKLSGGLNPQSCGNMKQNDKCQLNWTINASGDIGTVLVIDVNFSSDDSTVKHNDTEDHLIKIVAPPDLTPPIVNTTLNKSLTNIFQNDIINLSANVTDNIALANGSIIINDTGFKRFFNFSLEGLTAAKFSQNISVSCAAGCVINFTVWANDTSGNTRTNDTIITVTEPDTTPPRINASLNIPQIFQNIIVNMTANVTDNVGLDTCRFYMNGTSDGSFIILNKTVTGTSDQCSQNWTIDLEVGSVINFTVVINDTSTGTEGGNVNRSDDPTDSSIIGQILEVLPLNCTSLNKPGELYNLTQDASSAATCFYVQANNITLDCKGFEINYSIVDIGYGVNITSQNSTTIRSCDIVQADISSDNTKAYGIYIYRNSSNTSVFNNTIRTIGNDGNGIYLFQQVYNNSVYNNTITTGGNDAIAVYLHQSTNNNNIFNNNITTLEGNSLSPSYAVFLNNGVYNNDIYNNTITTNGDTGYGVYIVSTSYNNSVYGNTITTTDVSTYGVALTSIVYNNSVYGNTITIENIGAGVWFSTTAYDNFVYSNTINTTSDDGHGVQLSSTTYNNFVYNNTITTNGDNGFGMWLQSTVYNNFIYNNTITTSNINSHGIFLNIKVYNNTIYDNNITTKNTTGSYGIYLRNGINNNTFYRNTISSLAAGIVINGTGFVGESTRFNTFTNDTIVACTTGCADNYFDIVLTNNATDVTFLNVNFNKSRIAFIQRSTDSSDISNLTVKWYLDVNVTDSSDGSALQNAQVVINDSNAFNLFNDTTDSLGSIPTQIITEFTMNGSTNSLDFFTADIDSCDAIAPTHNITCFTPHNISVNITGFGTGDLSVAINRSKFVTIGLVENVPPIVNTTLNKSLTSIFQNDIINLSANVTDNIELMNGSIIINDTGFKRFFNFSLEGLTVAQFSQKITVSCAAGCVINFTAWVNDTSGNTRTNDTIITVTALGALFVNISSPINDTEVTANTTFTLIVNVTCLNANCGTVVGLARYNSSGHLANASISTIQGATPLFVNGTERNVTSIIENSSEDWNLGTAINVTINTDNITLGRNVSGAYPNQTGNFTSQVIDTGDTSSNFTFISWSTDAPYQTEIGRALGDTNDATDEDIFINTSGLVLLMHFNNETGENDSLVKDYSVDVNSERAGEVHNNGTCDLGAGECPAYNFTNKKLGAAAMNFDGVDDGVNLGTSCLVTNSKWTVEFWVYPSNPINYGRIFVQGSSGCSSRQISVIWFSDHIEVLTATDGSTSEPVEATEAITDADWSHFVWTFDGTTHTTYVNGVVSSGTIGGTAVGMGGDIFLGRRTAASGFFNGKIEEFALWNVSLSSDDALKLYKRGVLRLNLSVRSCNDNACSGEGFSETLTNASGIKLNETITPKNQFFQYKFVFNTEDANYTPVLYNVTINYSAGASLNPLSCGSMSQGDKCQLNWTINASGDVGSHLVIDVNFSSDDSTVKHNDTEDHLIKIVSGVAPPVVDTTDPIINGTLNETTIMTGTILNATFNATDNINLTNGTIVINSTGFNRFFNFTFVDDGDTPTNTQQISQNFTISEAAGTVINITGIARDNSSNTAQNDTIFTIQSEADAPIIKLNNVTFAVDPISGTSSYIIISFNVTDADGVTTINASKAIVNLTLDSGNDGQFRFNISDDEGSAQEPGTCYNHTQGTTLIINCTIEMRYYDNASASWVINVSIEDTSGEVGINDSISFTYNSLSAFSMTANHPGEGSNLNFTSLSIGDNDRLAKAPILLNNTGNNDFNQIKIIGADLLSGSNTLAIGSFSVNSTNNTAGLGAVMSAANVTIRARAQTTGLDNQTFLHGPAISGDTVPYTGVTDTVGNISLYFWIDVPTGLATGTYNNTWNITVVDLP